MNTPNWEKAEAPLFFSLLCRLSGKSTVSTSNEKHAKKTKGGGFFFLPHRASRSRMRQSTIFYQKGEERKRKKKERVHVHRPTFVLRACRGNHRRRRELDGRNGTSDGRLLASREGDCVHPGKIWKFWQLKKIYYMYMYTKCWVLYTTPP